MFDVPKSDRVRGKYCRIVFFLIILVFVLVSLFSVQYDKRNYLTSGGLSVEASRLPDHLIELSGASALEYMTDVNSIPGTTGPGIPVAIRSILTEKYGGVNTSATGAYGAVSAVERLEKECGWNSTLSNLTNPQCIDQFGFVRQPILFNIAQYRDDVDIVITSMHDLDFLEKWKPFFEHFHLIIVQDGDPDKNLKIPLWVDYELYNRRDIEAALGKDQSWIITSEDASIRNFGFLVSNKTFIYSIDDDCLPAQNDKGEQIDALSKHIRNLVTNSTPYFFNTLYDPYQEGTDFVRGYPYSLRKGVPTAISHGIWLYAPDYDAPTQLLKADERNTRLCDVTITVPAGVLYPMCSRNVAFNRKLIGPAFMQGFMDAGMPLVRYDDMFAGWASKVIADHLKLGVKTGAPYIRHNKASNPFMKLKEEYMGLFWQEDLIAFFQGVRFSSSARTPQACYLELARAIRSRLSRLHEHFKLLATAMEVWVRVWNQVQDGKLQFKPSRRSRDRNSKTYAVLTMCRSEKVYLSIWLKYYRRYFADEDIYILDNDSTDGSTSNLTVNVDRVHSSEYYDYIWMTDTVRNKTRDLLDSGYKYALYTDIDEIVVPNPLKYPSGLKEYIARTKQDAVRTKGYDLRHNVTSEAKLDLSKPILSQRRFWMRRTQYDKPLLTSKVLHWEVGFHNAQESVTRDDDLTLFHLQRMDHDIYMRRAEWKSKQNFKKEDLQRGWGVHEVLSGVEAEKFFALIVGEISEVPAEYRSPATF